ncbi:hypothetical protein GGR26_000167 [Lewinella marina]|uniref:thrombospondin type 3 repeat-containing protein n=1 Tax=Neolewinella marina TaxID=438751 RepID=UPI00169ADEB3|nr:thrombospondin type 3 repeat-containing protein [Neolewinella marina]NJB84422.1 hypothetical protein [Neolewinella marina]
MFQIEVINPCNVGLSPATVTDLTCPGSDDGAIAISATDARGNATFTAVGPVTVNSTDGTFTGLPSGTYEVTVTDDGSPNCTATQSNIIVGITTYSADNDGDGLGDVCDPDDDNDGILDVNDNCVLASNSDQADNDGDGEGDVCDPDDDNDGILDVNDNCVFASNTDQADNDGDGEGDVCDPDDDNDGVLDVNDNCVFASNSDQADNDGDGEGDVCDPDDDNDGVLDVNDNCVFASNTDQADNDGDGEGDVCDPDDDNDGYADTNDCAPFNPAINPGAEEVCDGVDNNCNLVVDESDAPELQSITLPLDPVAISEAVSISANFTDVDDEDGHSADIDWGDGTVSTGLVNQNTNSVSGSHQFSAAGVYTVSVTVTDACGEQDVLVSATYVVIYDPSAGFVTGGGWIWSPAGAYASDASLEGKANFGFVAKYKKGQSVPDGNTTFHLNAADFKFKSTDYQWLTIAGPNAKFKGSGQVNGAGDYGFMLTGVDGDVNGGGGEDKFRIKIWDKATSQVVYDNQMGADDTGYATTVLGGGSIVIHAQKGSNKSMGAPTPPPPAAPVDAVTNLQDLQIYPNPARDEVNLRFQALDRDARVTVFDAMGRSVVNQLVPAGQAQLRLVLPEGKFATGVYTIRLATGQQGITRRLLIER